MYPLMLIALLMPGTHVPKLDTPESGPKPPKIQAPAQAALRGLLNRCVAEARKDATGEDWRSAVGSTAYALTFDEKGRIAAIDFRNRLDAPLTPFQTCMRDGLQPWPLLAEGQNILRMGWPSSTTPNPHPPQLPTRPWHVVKPAHVCPAVGSATAPCVTADGKAIRGPKVDTAILTTLQRYHPIERIGIVGEGATAIWRSLRKARVKPNRVDVREESGTPLHVEIRRWRKRP
jgi:hypothetical protein